MERVFVYGSTPTAKGIIEASAFLHLKEYFGRTLGKLTSVVDAVFLRIPEFSWIHFSWI
jgi:hypothetical protein